MDNTHEGRCLCGAVRFQASGAPKWLLWRRCDSCRRHSGAPASVFVSFADDTVTIHVRTTLEPNDPPCMFGRPANTSITPQSPADLDAGSIQSGQSLWHASESQLQPTHDDAWCAWPGARWRKPDIVDLVAQIGRRCEQRRVLRHLELARQVNEHAIIDKLASRN